MHPYVKAPPKNTTYFSFFFERGRMVDLWGGCASSRLDRAQLENPAWEAARAADFFAAGQAAGHPYIKVPKRQCLTIC